MQRVVILGRGGAGKSTLAGRLGAAKGLPVVELDKHFWQPGLVAMRADEWEARQRELADQQRWIMDGDLGPHDLLATRLERADTVIVLDFPFAVCAWRALRRSRQRADFWRWVWQYRRRNLPSVMQAIANHAPDADLYVLRSPKAVRQLLWRAHAA
jgi:adenylate kinase family enzyme